MKPILKSVAEKLKLENVDGVVAAVDTTKEKRLSRTFEIENVPTFKYFT